MRDVVHTLTGDAPGTTHALSSLHYGPVGTGRKAYLQCALHADEIPGLLVGVHLRTLLGELETRGHLLHEVVLVPMANPLGLAQEVMGSHIGRFDLGSGVNYNRGYQYLTPGLKERMKGRWTTDAEVNVQRVREAAAALLDDAAPTTAAKALKLLLQRLAVDADVVLDLHCDAEALMHLYAGTPTESTALELARCIGAQSVLLAKESGDDPFDESVSRHWWELADSLPPEHPLPQGCFSVTIELRGESDVDHATARADALGLLQFLERTGHVASGAVAALAPHALPAHLTGETVTCMATPLEGVDPITAPCGGVVVFACKPGDHVQAGQVVAEVIDPTTGHSTPLKSRVDGLLFARSNRRYALRGARLAKVAGVQAIRTGKLLSP